MEVYAGYMEHTDYQVGRVVDALEDLEILDDTLIIYITGDNGGSGEGGPNGTFNWMIPLNGATAIETPEFMAARIDKFGTPDALNHYAVGWAHAMDTPYQWMKQVASHWGGTRNGTIVHWPNGFKARGEIRTQFSHVIDVATTVLDAAGIPEPDFVNGIQQMPLQGQSLVPSFHDADAPEFRETQYFEMLGNRGIYHQGWTACTKHGTPWIMTGGASPARRRRVGTVRPRRLVTGPRPREGDARETARAAAPVPDRGGQVQRAADRRPQVGAVQSPRSRVVPS